jgi:hypothetical protein
LSAGAYLSGYHAIRTPLAHCMVLQNEYHKMHGHGSQSMRNLQQPHVFLHRVSRLKLATTGNSGHRRLASNDVRIAPRETTVFRRRWARIVRDCACFPGGGRKRARSLRDPGSHDRQGTALTVWRGPGEGLGHVTSYPSIGNTEISREGGTQLTTIDVVNFIDVVIVRSERVR